MVPSLNYLYCIFKMPFIYMASFPSTVHPQPLSSIPTTWTLHMIMYYYTLSQNYVVSGKWYISVSVTYHSTYHGNALCLLCRMGSQVVLVLVLLKELLSMRVH